ncbi:hypothetical protein JK179_13780 [Gluconobacter wancherniae]|nr:hypothetical protein [Gluconobacter wancherniae]
MTAPQTLVWRSDLVTLRLSIAHDPEGKALSLLKLEDLKQLTRGTWSDRSTVG